MRILVALAFIILVLGLACGSEARPIPVPPTATAFPDAPTDKPIRIQILLSPNGGEVFTMNDMLEVRWIAGELGEPGVQRISLIPVESGCKVDKIGVHPTMGDMNLGDESSCRHIALYSDMVYQNPPNTSGAFSYKLSDVDVLLTVRQYYVVVATTGWESFDVSDGPIIIQ